MSADQVAGLKPDISRGSRSSISGRPINNEMQEAVRITRLPPARRSMSGNDGGGGACQHGGEIKVARCRVAWLLLIHRERPHDRAGGSRDRKRPARPITELLGEP